MTLPAGVTTCLITFGNAVTFLGADATVTGRLVVNRSVIHAATGTRVIPGNDSLANQSGSLSFYVPHTNQGGFVDAASGGPTTGWLYTLIATITVNGESIEVRKNFQPVVGQTAIDLDLVVDGPVTPGVTGPQAVVTSVAGHTGQVTAAQIAEAANRTTGWRDMGDIYGGGPGNTGRLFLRRDGSRVSLRYIGFAGEDAGDNFNLPEGFRYGAPRYTSAQLVALGIADGYQYGVFTLEFARANSRVGPGVVVRCVGFMNENPTDDQWGGFYAADTGAEYVGSFYDLQVSQSWATNDPWPASLPGTPADPQ